MKTANYNRETKGNSNNARQTVFFQSLKCLIVKKLVLILLMGMFMTRAFSQVADSLPTKTDYLQKYQNRKAAGWMLLGGGMLMTIIGSATYEIRPICIFCNESQLPPPPDNTLASALMLTGLSAMIGSIPFFISAHHQKKIAASLSIDNQSIKTFYQNTVVTRSQPVLKLKIDL